MKKETANNLNNGDGGFEAKKIKIERKAKEEFADFYSNILKVESQRREFSEKRKKRMNQSA